MTRPFKYLSIVGVDPTPRGLAFVFFEGGELLDWGHRSRSAKHVDDIGVLHHLINQCDPDVVVVEDPDVDGCRRRPRVRMLLAQMIEAVSERGVRVLKVARQSVRAAWSAEGMTAKQAVATAIAAQHLPELAAQVPPPRKAHMSEDARVNVFDAASLVLFCCGIAPPRDTR